MLAELWTKVKEGLSHKLEFLALKGAVMEWLHEYLYENTTYILSTAKLDATGHCCEASLANYNLGSTISLESCSEYHGTG